MSAIFNIIKFIWSHPLASRRKCFALRRFFGYQISQFLFPFPSIYQFTNRSKLIVQKGMTGANGNIYCGLHEFTDMAFVMHLLRPGDLFVDVGANVGSYTILASGHVGAHSISIEPIPGTFNRLKGNISLNGIEDRVIAIQAGVGSREGVVAFTADYDTVNHVVGIGEIEANTIEVSIKTLDSILFHKKPTLIKIDVEGFETEVLKGAQQAILNPSLIGIILELNGSGERYGYKDESIHSQLLDNGFLPYTYNPYSRNLTLIRSFGNMNTIYIRDTSIAKKRLEEAERFIVLGVSV